MYNVKIFFPNGELFKEHKNVNIATHHSGVGIANKNTIEKWYHGMVWFAERIDHEPNHYYEKDKRKPCTAQLFANNGEALLTVKGVFLEMGFHGNIAYFCDVEDGREKYIMSGSIYADEEQ